MGLPLSLPSCLQHFGFFYFTINFYMLHYKILHLTYDPSSETHSTSLPKNCSTLLFNFLQLSLSSQPLYGIPITWPSTFQQPKKYCPSPYIFFVLSTSCTETVYVNGLLYLTFLMIYISLLRSTNILAYRLSSDWQRLYLQSKILSVKFYQI